MIKYEVFTVGDLETNCYIVWDEDTKECAVIDPGDDGADISEEINNKKLKLKYILLTHGHFDHTLGVLDLKLIYGASVGCSSKDIFLLERIDETVKHFLRKEVHLSKFIKADIDLDKENEIWLGKEKLEIIKTPGHTPGGVCFYNKKNKILFSGDTLFAELRGRTDFSYSSTEKIFESLRKLMKLDPDTIVLSGHGEETTIGKESKIRNYF